MEDRIELEALLRDAGWLRRLAARLVGEGAADDLAQETWLAALRRPPRSLEEPRPWLARVARNLAANARRGRGRREAREERAHEERPEPTPDELAQAAEAQRLVAEAVTRLDPPLRAAVVLCYYRGLDSRAAAAQLGVPASTLRTRLQRALEELRAELDRKRGRESWVMLLTPLARGPELVAVGGVGALALAAVIGGAALVGGLAYVAWPGTSETSPEQDPRVTGDPSITPAAPGEPQTELHAGREALHAATDEPKTPRGGEAATARLSGTFLVDGRPPEWPFELTLATQLPPSTAGPSAPLWHPTHPNVVLAPEERGKFSFGGLPLDWKGRLAVEQFTFLDGTFALAFDAPAEDLVLHLTARPQILGRLLEPDGSPAGGVEVVYEYARDNGTLTSSLTTLADGRLRIFGGTWGERATLALVADGGLRGWLQLETAPFKPAAGLDLGELVLEPVRTRALTVHSTDGSPIPGACARIEVERPEIGCTSTTDATGQGKLFLPERACSVRVSAFGFADQVVTIRPTDALELELAPLAALTLTIVAPEVDALSLRAPRAAFVFDPADGRDRDYQQAAGASSWNERNGGRDGRPWSYRYKLHGPTTLTLVGLVPDQNLELELFDADGRSLAVHTTRLAAGERATLTLEAASER